MKPPLHIKLRQYRVVAISIITFFAWQTHRLTEWYFLHFSEMQEWQNAALVGLIMAYVGALKFAFDHITDEKVSHDDS